MPEYVPSGGAAGALAYKWSVLDALRSELEIRHVFTSLSAQGSAAMEKGLDIIRNREEIIEGLEERTMTDRLTGLANRSGFDKRYSEEAADAARLERPLAYVKLDLDGFKYVNDKYGHRAGDAMLQDIAAIMRGVLRSHDVVGRPGGDEFDVLMPGADADQAKAIAERIDMAVKAKFPDIKRIGVSYGVSSYPKDTDDPGNLSEPADRRMLRQKRWRHPIRTAFRYLFGSR